MVERNEKKKEGKKKKIGTEPGWLLPIEYEAGLGVLGAGLGVQGAQAVRRAAWAWPGALAGPIGGSCSQFGF